MMLKNSINQMRVTRSNSEMIKEYCIMYEFDVRSWTRAL